MNPRALLIIDVQQGLDEPSLGSRSTPEAESNINRLLNLWREHNLPVIHIRHCSTEPDSPLRPELPGYNYKEEATPMGGEKEFTKSVNSAFIGTGLEEYLRKEGFSSLVMIGMTTDHCVSTSARMADNLGFEVTVVSDATAAFERIGYDGKHYSADTVHTLNLVSLQAEFCTIRTTREIIQELAAG